MRKLQTELDQKNYENSIKIVESHDAAYRTYFSALEAYLDHASPTSADFNAMMVAGDIYFNQANMMCVCMLSHKVDPNSPEVWQKTTEATKKIGSASLSVVVEIAKSVGTEILKKAMGLS